ncbi:MAG: hypothetical protein HYZ47_02975 [Simkania negevensis]|nr:hypothetical protein [Simkania negevensis]
MEKFRITVAGLPDRGRLVAEILYEGVQWAEISQEKGDELTIQLYPHPRKKHWEFSYDEALKALEQAKNKLLEL